MQYEIIDYLRLYKRQIILWGSVLLVCILVLSFALWQQSIESRKGKIAVTIRTAPADATVTISSRKYKQGKQYVTPGEYKVRISKDGFIDATQPLRVNNSSQPAVYAGLAPKTAEAKQWYQRHRAEYAKIEQLSFQQSQSYGEAFQKKWPIVSSLPIRDPYFTIGYKNINDADILLTVEATSPRYRELAIEQLYKKGFDPTDYPIEFNGFKNPLREEE
jgi:hypothetical protein